MSGLSSPITAVLEHLGDGVLIVEGDGAIRQANAAARQFLGLGGAAADGARRCPENIRQLVAQAVAEGRPQADELTVIEPEERILQVRAIGVRMRGTPRAAVILRDVTELRRLERVRQDFVANVSHELRTPLTSIKGFIETLLHGAIDDPAHNRHFLTLVEEDVDRLARLTNDLLELSTVESIGKPKTLQAVDVLDILRDVVETLKLQIARKRISVTLPPAGPAHEARGDPDQIRQVCWNLLDNAVKYNLDGGRIGVEVAPRSGALAVRITDTGIGIPAEDLPRIFERFYRVDKARSRALGGTGLGLSIVKHIVEAHGGAVQVTSEPGQGSCFEITLPLWPA